MTAWFENDEFWRTFYPFLFPEIMFHAADAHVNWLLELTGFAGDAVLDLGCGPGRHAVALAKKGYRVTGVDLSPYLLRRAKTHATSAGVKIEWVHADMRRFVRPNAFDLTLSMFTSFGYFSQEQDNLQVLRNVWKSLKPGGCFLLDVMGKEIMARRWEGLVFHESGDGGLLIERRRVVNHWKHIENEWIHVKGLGSTSFSFRLRLYSAQELEDALREVGFSSIQIFGDFDGTEYGIAASRLISLCRK